MPTLMPRLRMTHICRRCHHKIKKGEPAWVFNYADREKFEHTNPDCVKGSNKRRIVRVR